MRCCLVRSSPTFIFLSVDALPARKAPAETDVRTEQTDVHSTIGTDEFAESNCARPTGTSLMGVLARTYPELSTLTADATLTEIKTLYGLDTFEQVCELARDRRRRRRATI
jgi:hypothetical protein